MAQIGTSWAGNVFGTNTGNFYLKFDEVEPRLRGTLRHLDPAYGVHVYAVEGTFDGNLHLVGTPQQPTADATNGDITISGMLTPEGHLRGEWSSAIGTGGTFVAFPHDQSQNAAGAETPKTVQEQFHSRTMSVGSVSLYKSDILALLSEVKRDFSTGRVTVTYSTGIGESTRYAEDVVDDIERLKSLTYLKLQVQEPEVLGINRVVAVELRAFGTNEVKVQGINESWVIGRAQALASFLRGYENAIVTNYKKFGLNLNSIIFLGMLIVIPEIHSLAGRTFFVVVVVLLLAALLWLHTKLIPNATISLSGAPPGRIGRLAPTLLSWLSAIITSIIAAYIYTWLTQTQ
jgi:hypothetical protein